MCRASQEMGVGGCCSDGGGQLLCAVTTPSFIPSPNISSEVMPVPQAGHSQTGTLGPLGDGWARGREQPRGWGEGWWRCPVPSYSLHFRGFLKEYEKQSLITTPEPPSLPLLGGPYLQ